MGTEPHPYAEHGHRNINWMVTATHAYIYVTCSGNLGGDLGEGERAVDLMQDKRAE